MITGATRSRAAILCFGGWGLQTLLHLQPRLQAIQETRHARKVEGPDLTQITQLAALLTEASVGADGRVPLHLRQLRAGANMPPFYVEGLLERLDQKGESRAEEEGWFVRRAQDLLHNRLNLSALDSERRAGRLLDATQPLLHSLNSPGTGYGYRNGSGEKHTSPVSRGEVFWSAVHGGLEMARLLEANLIAPIRQDNLVPGDPFVQTTLYVVAPLFEPLASALVWPTLVHLLNYMGERHISQIVGIFGLGSYATDSSRAVEDAVSYAALAEIEALTGLRPEATPIAERFVHGDGIGGPAAMIREWVGRPIFDRIYLVDREKSNQGLMRNSYELSVLVANALQALVTSDGSQHLDEQLGIDMRNAHERPYSLLGAAEDYVPLEYIFEAVQQQEEKRLVREVILDGEARAETPAASLGDLGITAEGVMAQLITQMPDLFLNVTPARIDDLQVHPDFVLPPAIAGELRPLSPETWLAGFGARLQVATNDFNRLAGPKALDKAWGLDGLHPNGVPRNPNDRRMLPAAAAQMRRFFVEMLAESPAGLRQAQETLAGWRADLERERAGVAEGYAPGQRHMAASQRQLALRQWQNRYTHTLVDQPSWRGTLLRSTLLIVAVLLLSAIYVFAFNPPVNLIVDGGTLLGIGIGAYVGGALSLSAPSGQRAALAA